MSDGKSGTVKWFDDSKGYGFIRRDGGSDNFVHMAAIEMDAHRTLQRGQRVTFTVMQENKGPRASHVAHLHMAEDARWARQYR